MNIQNRAREANGDAKTSGKLVYFTKQGKRQFVKQRDWPSFSSSFIHFYMRKENVNFIIFQNKTQ